MFLLSPLDWRHNYHVVQLVVVRTVVQPSWTRTWWTLRSRRPVRQTRNAAACAHRDYIIGQHKNLKMRMTLKLLVQNQLLSTSTPEMFDVIVLKNFSL